MRRLESLELPSTALLVDKQQLRANASRMAESKDDQENEYQLLTAPVRKMILSNSSQAQVKLVERMLLSAVLR